MQACEKFHIAHSGLIVHQVVSHCLHSREQNQVWLICTQILDHKQSTVSTFFRKHFSTCMKTDLIKCPNATYLDCFIFRIVLKRFTLYPFSPYLPPPPPSISAYFLFLGVCNPVVMLGNNSERWRVHADSRLLSEKFVA